MTDPRTLKILQDQVRTVAKELTEQTNRPVIRDDFTTTTHETPSLLDQLRDAVTTGGETLKGGRRNAPLPISVAAHDMLTQIETDAVDLHLKALTHDALTAEDRIKALAGIVGRWTDGDAVNTALTYMAKWAAEIRQLLDPPRRLHVAAACPACDTRMVYRQDETGETVQVPALTVDGTVGCTCLSCHHVWPPGNLEHLAMVLGCEPIRDTPDEAA